MPGMQHNYFRSLAVNKSFLSKKFTLMFVINCFKNPFSTIHRKNIILHGNF